MSAPDNTISTVSAFSSSPAYPADGVALLTEWGVIRVAGEDAGTFLQNQLTQDVILMKVGEGRLAAVCSPKGRILASFFVLKRANDEFLLVCAQDLLASTLKRLSMFVLRAKARLTDASGELALYGLMGSAVQTVASALSSTDAASSNQACLCPLWPADRVERALLVQPAGVPLPATLPELDAALWKWADVRSGVAMVSLAVKEVFVPQMLNYESIGGVNFKKGCYPGQEVVARSQFRGAIKRRAFVAQVAGHAEPGQEIYSAQDPDQPCGTVAAAATAPDGGTAVIVSMQTAVLEGVQTLHVGSANGPAMTDWHVPYELLTDI